MKQNRMGAPKEGLGKKKYQIEAEKLKVEVISCTFSKSDTPVALLELVDEIDKFGLTNYFDVQTKAALEKTIMCMKSSSSTKENKDLYATALCFRLLRQHGYYASQDMLKELLDSKGTKKMSDIKTLLELLEGSYLSMDGENLLNDIRLFTTNNLMNTSFTTNNKENLSNYFPLAWRVRWYDVRRHITMFAQQGNNNTNQVLLNLAKLNFNIIQATHLKDLKDVIRALYDTEEEISAEIDDQQKGCCPSAFARLKQGWLNFCKAMLVEAKWYNEGHISTLEEYLNNGWISSTVPLLSDYAELERGDVASSIICYMQQENVSEDIAREHIESIILDSWKKINYHFNTLSTSHREIAKHVINIARMGHVMYQFGDGFGVQDGKTRHQILINLMEPIT
ncbi:hypothetical protein KY290_018381 [Solanum tuberosum]|uniref:Uncharacterized protein n=1 Tax=Solanum tuberosum TaxID=4113 RepID=A0ABQ7VG34_SOLTU|nr:hypothetical protein KY290_018381 [Solanum tuberosum]